ncbi:MAG TPA: hypothetical protein VH394_13985 [Thermoanaerobaculia bacterium]|jgi:hypothetical protein|nr:hypothetical protein [Thermoanaerobaculia bacterium]
MSDNLIQRFEDGTLPNTEFHHRDHVRLAWLYLKEEPVLGALTRFTEGLKRFAARHGHAGLYHETITWAYFFLIHERMAGADAAETWETFAERNPDLLTWKPSVLNAYYQAETLASPLAKRVFVLPDRQAPAMSGGL